MVGTVVAVNKVTTELDEKGELVSAALCQIGEIAPQ